MGFSWECKASSILKKINKIKVIHHFNHLKKKKIPHNHINRCRKYLMKHSIHSWLYLKLSRLGVNENVQNLIKRNYENSKGNIITVKSWMIFSYDRETKQEYLLSQLLFNIILNVLANAVRWERERKSIWIGKEEMVHL